jgi:branched-chain amino acid transport system permease protein
MDTHLILQGAANGLTLGCLIGLLAVGYSLVYGVARLINFAHGDVFTLAGYYIFFFVMTGRSPHSVNVMVFLVATCAIAAFAWGHSLRRTSLRLVVAFGGALLGAGIATFLIGRGTTPLVLTVLAAVVLIAVAGVAFEYLVYRPLEGAPRLSYLVAAIGLSLTLQASMQLLFGSERRSFPEQVHAQLSRLPVPGFLVGYFSGLDLLIVGFTFAITIAATWLARSSKYGIAIRATADDPILATRIGIDVRAAKVQVFALGSALAGVAAFFFIARERVLEPTLGYTQGVLAFAAAVIGGIGRLTGALVGGLFIGVVLSMLPLIDIEPLKSRLPDGWSAFLPSFNLSDWGIGIVYFLLALVLVIRPRGIISEQFWRDV